jgi:hypothetical protein
VKILEVTVQSLFSDSLILKNLDSAESTAEQSLEEEEECLRVLVTHSGTKLAL